MLEYFVLWMWAAYKTRILVAVFLVFSKFAIVRQYPDASADKTYFQMIKTEFGQEFEFFLTKNQRNVIHE